MKKLLLLLTFVALTIFVQAQTNKPEVKAQIQPTDSTELLSIKDVDMFLKFLEDKLLAKDYLIVQGAVSQLVRQRFSEWIKKRN